MSPNALRLLACTALATLWLLLLLWCCLPVPAVAAALSHAIPLPNHKKAWKSSSLFLHSSSLLHQQDFHLHLDAYGCDLVQGSRTKPRRLSKAYAGNHQKTHKRALEIVVSSNLWREERACCHDAPHACSHQRMLFVAVASTGVHTITHHQTSCSFLCISEKPNSKPDCFKTSAEISNATNVMLLTLVTSMVIPKRTVEQAELEKPLREGEGKM